MNEHSLFFLYLVNIYQPFNLENIKDLNDERLSEVDPYTLAEELRKEGLIWRVADNTYSITKRGKSIIRNAKLHMLRDKYRLYFLRDNKKKFFSRDTKIAL